MRSSTPSSKKTNKYHAKRVEHAGRSFASKLESEVYDMLLLRLKGGEIIEIQCQTHVHLTKAKILYIPDFKCKLPDESIFYVEAKGFETDLWRIKRRLWIHYGPAKLEIWMKNWRGLYITEILNPSSVCESDKP